MTTPGTQEAAQTAQARSAKVRPADGSAADEEERATGGTGVKSARRALDLMETFAAHDTWLTLAELHTLTGFPRSSLHGLLRTLLDVGWLEQDAGAARYRLGIRALVCGTAYLDRDAAMPFATEALEQIRERTGFTAHYARRSGDQVVYLETREAKRSTHLISRVGRSLPVHATALGKALLAELTPAEVDALLPTTLTALTAHTVVSREGLRAACERARELGYATEREEGTPGIRCVAAVVPYRIPASDAISCSLPVDQIDDAGVREIGELLVEVTARLGRELRRAGIR
ncbi:IclR family transcriptional regulator [Streptomyces sp. DSM 41982]|uniref:Glycerol operon regulatory protein n=1 Tax=Streptomyces evansiae TaxID=3075535 RepID=A0ABD5E283_9ACTN|nr:MULTISPECIES: IclR family transcriptional regulator [unclassified Streptomyces]MDT0414907.1 IclR family transcriptional regulator [Streptomyces sp. DSM 41982]SCD67871.1 transcriptional regulator, IclR family [Streptomyces sp. SolWspMP-sol7th]